MKRVVLAAPGLTAALLWIFTALYFRPSVDLLLLFSVLFAGAGILAQMAAHWAAGSVTSAYAFSASAAGVALVTFAGVELAFQPDGPRAPLRLLLQLLMLGSFAYMVRVQRREKSRSSLDLR
ncbi:MAG TPA: hypothetical protein VF613_01235 [Longimicrobium sp.]